MHDPNLISTASLLDLLVASVKPSKSLVSHPLCEAGLSDKLLYLNMLALLRDRQSPSGHYFDLLLARLGVESSLQESFDAFQESPDHDVILAFIQRFRGEKLAVDFLSDALMLVACEAPLADEHKSFFDRMALELQLLGSERDGLYQQFQLIKDGYVERVDHRLIAPHILSYFVASSDEHGAVSINKPNPAAVTMDITQLFDETRIEKLKESVKTIFGTRKVVSQYFSLAGLLKDDVILSLMNRKIREADWYVENHRLYKSNGEALIKLERLNLVCVDGYISQTQQKFAVSQMGTRLCQELLEEIFHEQKLDHIDRLFKHYGLKMYRLASANGTYFIPTLLGRTINKRIFKVNDSKFISAMGETKLQETDLKNATNLALLFSSVPPQLELI